MKTIRPITITDAMLTASNVPETDGTAGEWGVGVSYTDGDTVRVTTTGVHKVYEALVDVTGGDSPEDDVLNAVPKWLEISSTNRWKAFDEKVGSQTSQATSITYTIEPGVIVDSFAFLNMTCATIQVVSTDPIEGEVYNETISMLSTEITGVSGIYDWYTYFFSSNSVITDVVRFNLPPYSAAVLTITITLADGIALCGGIILGPQAFLGNTQYSPSIGIRDYSVKQTDQFGNQTLVKRSFAKIMTADMTVETASISDVQNILASYRAELIVYVGDDNTPALIVYGFYKDFNIVISYPAYAICSLDVEGIT